MTFEHSIAHDNVLQGTKTIHGGTFVQYKRHRVTTQHTGGKLRILRRNKVLCSVFLLVTVCSWSLPYSSYTHSDYTSKINEHNSYIIIKQRKSFKYHVDCNRTITKFSHLTKLASHYKT